MEDDVRSKEFPTNYSSDAVRVLDTMSFTKGRSVGLLGSMSLRSQQYAGDYDAFEIVNMKETSEDVALHMLAVRFKEIVKDVKALSKTFIGDIKAGSIEDWRVLPRDAKVKDGKLIGMDVVASRKKLDELEKAKVISPNEKKYGESLLTGKMTPIRFLEAKQKLKFHIVRWTTEEVIRGSKRLRDGRTFTLEEAFSSPSITKMDVISYVQNNRYTDFSMIYYFRNNGKVLNPDPYDFVDSIKENILYYSKKGNLFKVLKRKFALAKFERDASTIERLTPILNSDLGRVYHVLGDIGTLIHLLEDERPDPKSVKFEIDQFINRLANVYTLSDYLKEEHTILGEIQSALKDPKQETLLAKLRGLEDRLERILNENTKKVMKGKLKGGAIDPTTLFPVDEPKYETRDVRVGTRTEDYINPAWDAKKPRKGVKRTLTREVPIMERKQVAVGNKNEVYKNVLLATEAMLRRLSHVYEHRNPPMSLGFRVIADDIYQVLPQYDGNPKRNLDDGHKDAQAYTAKTILAEHDRYPFPQRNPKQRFNEDVRPTAEKAMRADNPFRAVAKKGDYGWDAPPRTLNEASFFLGSRPDIPLT